MPKLWIDFTSLRARARFEPVLARYGLEATGRGSQKTLLCPFHEEAEPSCKVNLEKRAFHCFGCGAKGNVLDFVARMENAELPEAARTLAEICGIPLAEVSKAQAEPKSAGTSRPQPHRKPQEPREAHTSRQAAPAPQTLLCEPPGASQGPVNPPLSFRLKLDPAHPYLAERGLHPEVVEAFGLGYCSRGMMKGRICIPIHNEAGELVAYTGRWPGDSGWPAGEEKYKLPPGFRKSLVLFNLERIARGPRPEELILVEGFFSVFRLHAIGVPAVALMGAALSDEQAALLAAHASRITVLTDGDAAGRAARAGIVPRLAERLYVHAPLLPEGTSPDMLDEETLTRFVSRLSL